MEVWRSLLVNVVKAVREKILPLFSREDLSEVIGIGAGGDQKYKIDAIAEEIALQVLSRSTLNFTLISEESGIKNFGSTSAYIVLDCLDGSLNFVRGFPFSAISIAFSDAPNLAGIKIGVVMDVFSGDMYIAEHKKGAWLNSNRIKTSTEVELQNAILGINLGGLQAIDYANIHRLLPYCRRHRHLGANALELCYLASGKIDAFVELRNLIRVTDIAAAYLIVKEAGGHMNFLGKSPSEITLSPATRVRYVAAGSLTLLERLLRILNP